MNIRGIIIGYIVCRNPACFYMQDSNPTNPKSNPNPITLTLVRS